MRKVKVKVPATSANIGPGFDSLGMALDLYNTYTIEEMDSGLYIEGCEKKYANDKNLIYIAMQECFKKTKHYPRGVKIKIESDIPVSRGLGSSAACIIGGILAANELSDYKLSQQEVLELATEIEGHPDNVAPALLGGMVVSVYDKEVYYSKINIKEGLKFLALIPNFKLPTKQSRSILPKVIPHSDATFNVGRVALMVSALHNGEFDLLKVAGEDKLHQHYRGTLIDGYQEILDKGKELGAKGVFLSGAGPTILVALDSDDHDTEKELKKLLDTLKDKWEIKRLELAHEGASVRKG